MQRNGVGTFVGGDGSEEDGEGYDDNAEVNLCKSDRQHRTEEAIHLFDEVHYEVIVSRAFHQPVIDVDDAGGCGLKVLDVFDDHFDAHGRQPRQTHEEDDPEAEVDEVASIRQAVVVDCVIQRYLLNNSMLLG